MPNLLGTNIGAPIRPYDTECTYPTAYTDEIAGTPKHVTTEAALANIPAERRPIGTLATIGIGRFKQWNGSIWQDILQGFDPPTVAYEASEIKLQFGGTDVPLKPATSLTAGFLSAAMYQRLIGHASRHLDGGDDSLASKKPAANQVPQADATKKIDTGWLPVATDTSAGTVRIALDGTSPPVAGGTAPFVLSASDSRLAQLEEISQQIAALGKPVVYVNSLPATFDALPNVFYWVKAPANTLYLLVDGEWTIATSSGGGTPGKSAYEIALDQGFEGSIADWLNGLGGHDGLDGLDGKSAYEIAVQQGYAGTESAWLASLQGEDGISGVSGSDGKSAYEVAKAAGFLGTQDEWLTSLKGEKGEKGDSGDGKSAYAIAVQEGFSGTQTEWVASLKGATGAAGPAGTIGADGKSAYESAQLGGFTGTQSEWLASLKGEKGDKGAKGDDGQGLTVLDYYTTEAALLAAHPTGTSGECYGAAGHLYLWADNQWQNVGKITGASAYEVWLEQPENAGKTFDEFFQALADAAFAPQDLTAIIDSRINNWAAVSLPGLLATAISSHITDSHTWRGM